MLENTPKHQKAIELRMDLCLCEHIFFLMTNRRIRALAGRIEHFNSSEYNLHYSFNQLWQAWIQGKKELP